ncbi:bifunctional 2-polyprenyl-6-hydroxyphenol methylase/3-demethylubiquinol 3-O-methyltransferase UbiG [Conexibacter sp. DBS9H8]|uniref:class I SAM-dependent methyltransferase n=1 Tax=Conexibacter sp. DBS9H8 TaxID=2937801 RepID=UPI00200DC648|nr:class I SAM-dependent methyltransferase [Conexibacter sp. DBS9H8]
MLEASAAALSARLTADALVLDVGGGASPLPRADWVLDLIAHADRGLYGAVPDRARERFSADTWVQRDICDRAPWPFVDDQFDFVVCSHTLEDVRDPIWVCSELVRVARAGYIEVPSRLEEQAYGVQGPWAGWGHHRWLIDLDGNELTFVAKHHVLHNRPAQHFPAGFHERLTPEERVLTLWWTGAFGFRERIFTDAAALDAYLEGFVAAHRTEPEQKDLLTRLKLAWTGADK